MHRQMPGLLLAFDLSLVPRHVFGRGSREPIQGMLRLLGRAYLPTIGVFRPSQVASECCFSDSTTQAIRTSPAPTKDAPIKFFSLKSLAG